MCREREKEKGEGENEDPSAARKVLKADREKLRRDRLNEHFQELGNALGSLPPSSFSPSPFSFSLSLHTISYLVS